MKRVLCVVLSVIMTVAVCVFPVSATEKVTLTYDLMYDGKTFSQEVEKGKAPEQAYFEREGYDSYQFYTDSSFSKHFDFSAPLNTNQTVYVRWLTDDELADANIYLDPNDEYPVASGEVIKGEPAGQFSEPGRDGDFFAGWYLNRSCTIPYDPTAVIYHSFDLFPCFTENPDDVVSYSIFESPQSEEPIVGGYLKKGLNIFNPATPEVGEDMIFEGWYFDRELRNKIDFAQPVTDSYISLYPRILAEDDIFWAAVYLDATDSEPVGYNFAQKGDPIPVPAAPGRTDEYVSGWYTDRALTKKADFTSPNYSDVSLFPRWEKAHSHSITEVPEKAATATTDGCKKHLLCTECGKWFYPVATALLEIENHDEMLIPAFGPVIKGDADGDGSVNISDATAIQYFIAEMEQEQFCREAARVSGSGKLGINDATYIQFYLAELIDKL